jgi:hypothetical protein
MTSREAAMIAFGQEAVETAERVRAFQTRWGLALEAEYAAAVGGRRGGRGEADVVSRLGEWAFASQATTKNAAGNRADLAQVGPGRLVQVSGKPRRGWISGIEYLRVHGIRDPERVAGECETRALRQATRPLVEPGIAGQLRLA